MKYTIGKEYEFSDNKIDWKVGFLKEDYAALSGRRYQAKAGNTTEWFNYIREIKDNSQPSIGTTFTFDKEFDPKWAYLRKAGWEDGDTLEIVAIKDNSKGKQAYIVLNTQEDVLSTAAIVDIKGLMEETTKLVEGQAYQFDYYGYVGLIGIYNKEHGFENGVLCCPKLGTKINSLCCTNIKLLVPEEK